MTTSTHTGPMTKLPPIPGFPYVALVRVPLVVDALFMLVLLASDAPRNLFVILVSLALFYTLPLELCAIAATVDRFRRFARLRTWRHWLALFCGVSQATLVLAIVYRLSR